MDIKEVKSRYPMLAGMDDVDAAKAFHQHFYPDFSEEEVAKRLGVDMRPKVPDAPAPDEGRTVLGTAKDLGLTALKGAMAVPEAAVGLLDIPTGGRVGEALEDVGLRFKDANAILDDSYSPAQKKANKAVADAEGVGGKFMAALQNPSTIAHTIGQSVPSMLAGGVVGRGVAALAPRIGAVGAAAAGEGITAAGSAAEQIRQGTDTGVMTAGQSGIAALSGAATGAFGLLGGKVAKSLGIADLDTAIVRASAEPAVAKSLVRRTLEGAMSEGVLEELPQSISEQVLQNYALGKPLDEGVDQAAVMGLLSGAAMGGGMNALHGTPKEAPPAAPAAPDASAVPPLGYAGTDPQAIQVDPQGNAATWQDRATGAPEGVRGFNDVTAVPPIPPGSPPPDAAAPLGLPAPTITVGPDGLARTAEDRNDRIQRIANGDVISEVGQPVQRPLGPLARAAAKAKPQDIIEVPAVVAPAQHQTTMFQEQASDALGTQPGAVDEHGVIDSPDNTSGIAGWSDDQLRAQLQSAQAPEVRRALYEEIGQREVATEQSSLQDELDAEQSAVANTQVDDTTFAKLNVEDSADSPQPSDLLNAEGKPFTIRGAAARAGAKAGSGYEPVKIKGGWVARKLADAATPGDGNGAQATQNQQTGSQSPKAAGTPGQAQRNPAEPKKAAQQVPADDGMTAFPAETGTLGVPRAEMPQVPTQSHGGLVKHLNAQGIGHETKMVDAAGLKPTQAEYSPTKVDQAKSAQGDRAVIVSGDGHIIDGHHQAMAAAEEGKDVKAIVLDAPAEQALEAVKKSPSASQEKSAIGEVSGDQDDATERVAEAQDKKESPATLKRLGLQLPNGGLQNKPGTEEILAEAPSVDSREESRPDNVGQRGADEKAAAQAALFSRGEPTKQGYESRIDELFAGGKPNRVGVKLLDSSDMLGLLGHSNKPVILQESKVIAGQSKHPNMQAADWKKVPQWLETPAAVFKSATVPGRLVFVAPETVAGSPVLIVVEPNAQLSSSLNAHLTVNAYDAEGGTTPFVRWARDGLALYIDQKEFPAVLDRAGLQLPRKEFQNRPGTKKILTEKQLGGYRKAQAAAAPDGPAMSRSQQEEGSGAEVKRVQSQVDAIKSRWPNAPEVVVATHMQDDLIPERVRQADEAQRSAGAEGAPEGFFYEGKVYLVASELRTPKDVTRVLFHEALGHFGLRGVFGQDLASILNRVALNRRVEVIAKAREYGLVGENIDPQTASDSEVWQSMTQQQRQYAAEEVLAVMAQDAPGQPWVQRTIAAIRSWMRRNLPAFRQLRLTDAEIIRDYIVPARKFVEQGAKAGQQSSPAFSRGAHALSVDTFPAEFMNELAAVDSLFQNPRVQAGSAEAALRQIDPTVKFIGNVTAADEHQESGADSKLLFRTAKGRDFYVFEKGDEIWLDVSRLGEGDGGSAIYAALMDYAASEGKVFVGDPAGLSDVAMRRRLEAMISSAIKHGSTDHMQPHERQVEGDEKLGIPALQWRAGDTIGNIQRMIDVSLASIAAHVPEFKRARYDFATGTFRSSQGAAITDADLRGWTSKSPRMRAAGVGLRSIKRGILLNTLAHAESGQRPGLLEQALRQPRQLVGDQAQGIFYSRTPSAMRDLRSQVGEALNSRLSHPGTLSWWHKTIGTMYNLAEQSPAFKKVYQSAQAYIDDISQYALDAADRAPNLIPRLEDWRSAIKKRPVSTADTAAIAAPIFEGTLIWVRDLSGKPVRVEDAVTEAQGLSVEQKAQRMETAGTVDPGVLRAWRGLPVTQYEKNVASRFESQHLTGGVVWSEAELRSQFKLNDRQVGLYKEYRTAIDRSLDTTTRSDIVRIGGALLAPMRDIIMDAANIGDAMMAIDSFVKQEVAADPGKANAYADVLQGVKRGADRLADLQARGYAPLQRFGEFTVHVAGEKEGDASRYFGMFETKQEANAMAAKLRKEFGDSVVQGTLSKEEHKLLAGITPESLEIFGDMLGLAGAENGTDHVYQEFLRKAKSDQSALKRMIHRQGIAGFSEDVGRGLASFIYSNARMTSAGLHIGDIGKAVADIPKNQGQMRDAAERLRQHVLEPQEKGAGIRAFMFAQYLGGSLASAAVNLTQPLTTSLPYLSRFGGAAKAGQALVQASIDMASGGKAYGPELTAALERAEKAGVVSPQEIHYLMGQARGSGSLRSGDGTKAGQVNAMRHNAWEFTKLAWGTAFGWAEQVNRRMTFVAAYRMAKENKVDNPYAFAAKAVDETQFVQSKANKMEWGRGAVGGTLMTFKGFSIAYLELMYRMWNAGEAGSRERADGRKAVMIALGTLMLFGGGGGLPFLEDAEDVATGFGQMLGFNWNAKKARQDFLERTFGRELAQFMDKGLSGVPGVPIDVSGRLGMGNLIPGTGLLQEKTSYTRDYMEMLGPAGDFVSRVAEGGKQVLGGAVTGEASKVMSGVMQMAPKAVANLEKGVDMGASGTYKDKRGGKVSDVNMTEAIMKAIGFQPSSVADIQEGNYLRQQAKNFYNMKSQEIRALWAKGIAEKDQDIIARARAALKDWNTKNPDQPMVANLPAIIKKAKEMQRDKADRIAATAPKAMRTQMKREILEAKGELLH